MDEEDKVICPVCDHVITDFEEGISDPCEHVMVTYVDILNGEFVHVGDEELAEELMAQYTYLEENECDQSLDEIMEAYANEHEGYEVTSLTTSGLACGPCSSTEYHLIKIS